MLTWTSDQAKAHALSVGFDVCQITSVEEGWAAGDRLKAFVEAGYHGEMGWMEETLDRRSHPRAMWAEARSAFVVGVNYGPDHDPLDVLAHKDRAAISVYAKGKDYHDVLKKRLKQFAREFVAANKCQVKVFVDTAPLMEKPLAQKAGLGWQGKHTNLVSRDFGSWLFLGVMLTDAEFVPDDPSTDHCGQCRACLDICPTDAFTGPYQIDARKCISYLTIEHGGPIPHELRKPMGNRIYGCDDCLAVCPWNKFARTTKETKFQLTEATDAPSLARLLALDEEGFRAMFAGSPVKRIKRRRFLRNVLIAAGNSGSAELIPHVKQLLDDEEELVRGSAIWALNQLDPGEAITQKQTRASEETCTDVLSEWHLVQ